MLLFLNWLIAEIQKEDGVEERIALMIAAPKMKDQAEVGTAITKVVVCHVSNALWSFV